MGRRGGRSPQIKRSDEVHPLGDRCGRRPLRRGCPIGPRASLPLGPRHQRPPRCVGRADCTARSGRARPRAEGAAALAGAGAAARAAARGRNGREDPRAQNGSPANSLYGSEACSRPQAGAGFGTSILACGTGAERAGRHRGTPCLAPSDPASRGHGPDRDASDCSAGGAPASTCPVALASLTPSS